MKAVLVIRIERLAGFSKKRDPLLNSKEKVSEFSPVAKQRRSKLRHYKENRKGTNLPTPSTKCSGQAGRVPPGNYEGVTGTRSLRARGTILNSTGRRARGSPSTWA